MIKKNIAIVLGSFHKDFMNEMLNAAREEAQKLDLNIVQEVWVPGSMEKPFVIKKLMQRVDIDGIAVLGIIEKGGTQHGAVMGHTVIDKILDLQLEYMKPMGMGVIGPGAEPDQIPPRTIAYAKKAISALSDMFRIEI